MRFINFYYFINQFAFLSNYFKNGLFDKTHEELARLNVTNLGRKSPHFF